MPSVRPTRPGTWAQCIRGIGGLLYLSIRTREGATVVAVVTILVLVFLLVNLLVDILYGAIDPRIRYE